MPRPPDPEAETDTVGRESCLGLEHSAVVPSQLPTHAHFHCAAVSATSRKVPVAQPFVTALLQLPFVRVSEHVALVGLLQSGALQVNVADPVRQEAAFAKVTLEPSSAVLVRAEQSLPHVRVSASHSRQVPVQDSVCSSAGLGLGQAVLPHGQLTVRVRV